MITERTGNIFNTSCQTIVNTINTVGFMGKGIALEMQLRYPEMCDIYKILCKVEERYFTSSQLTPAGTNHDDFSKRVYLKLKQKYGDLPRIDVGKLWLYTNTPDKWILNFPTKIRWQDPSKIEYLEKGLIKFVETYQQKGITSIAFPILGGALGGIPTEQSIFVMKKYLKKCNDIKIEIWHYDKTATDDLYSDFKNTLLEIDPNTLSMQMRRAGYTRIPVDKIYRAINNPNIYTISQMMAEPGIGYQTAKKVFEFVRRSSNKDSQTEETNRQMSFDI